MLLFHFQGPLLPIQLHLRVVGERNIVFSFGSLKLFLKARDYSFVNLRCNCIKNELNSEAVLKLFVSILLLMCKLLGCGLFVGFVLTNSFMACHTLVPFSFCSSKKVLK